MGKILEIIESLSGGTCYQTEKFSLDHFIPPDYEDKDEVFSNDRIFETGNKSRKNIQLNVDSSNFSLFKYFLDGSRRVYKIADFGTTDGKFLPIVAGQIGAAIGYRENGKIKKYKLERKNVLAVPNRMGDEFEKMTEEICQLKFPKDRRDGLSIAKILKYDSQPKEDRSFEKLATAKIQLEMMNMEVSLVREMVCSTNLKSEHMLIIDGSLQFSSLEEGDFKNVIGVAKSPNPTGILISKNKQIGNHLVQLKFGERTPVFAYESEDNKRKRKTQIGAWYLRIHPKENMKRPLDGVIKIEKIATTRSEKEDGFATEMINEISKAILVERNVTCYGNDDRWANHLYPIYLTELLLKNSFVSNIFFLNIF